MIDKEMSKKMVDKVCQSFTVIVILNIVDVIIRIHAPVYVVEGAVLLERQALSAGDMEE